MHLGSQLSIFLIQPQLFIGFKQSLTFYADSHSDQALCNSNSFALQDGRHGSDGCLPLLSCQDKQASKKVRMSCSVTCLLQS